jgi:hypothetical protein
MSRRPNHTMPRPHRTRCPLLLAALLAIASPAAAQQCLGLTPTAQARVSLVQEASRSRSATVDRSRVMLAVSRAMALTASSARQSYLDTQGMPWEAKGVALQLTVEGPTGGTTPLRLCPMVEVSGLRSNVADWGIPQEWKMSRFAPGVAAGWAHAAGPDITLIPFAAGSLVIEGFETLQPGTTRETRSYAVLEVGTGIVLYNTLTLRFAVPVPVGRRDGYPGPYTMRTFSAGVTLNR